jgi:peptidoglycan hydrolase-like protein with peptidoglycan-binding domain
MMQERPSNEAQDPVPYRLQQLHSPARGNQPVADLEGLVTHHPGANARAQVVDGVPVNVENPRTRSYGVIGGEIQELETRRTDGGAASALRENQVLLTKDFMLEDSRIAPGGANVRAVDVPAPVAGYVARVDASRLGAVDIYDREGGELVARILHMDPVRVSVGDTVEYGQALGTQSNKGLPQAGKHVHMEVDTRYYQQFENYLQDLGSGRLSVDEGRRTHGIEPRPVVDDATIRIGESSDLVLQAQRTLNRGGFHDAEGRPLQEDGVYRLSMQPAVINYQRATGLPQTGDLDPATLGHILPRVFPPELNNPQHDGLPSYLNLHGSERSTDDPLHRQAEDAVRRLEQSLGRDYDGNSERLAASAACLAKENGLSRVDHVVLSQDTGTVRQGENLFVVQGELNNPAHLRAHMRTDEALAKPVEQSLAQLQTLNDTQSHQQAPQVGQPEQVITQQHRMA